MSDVLKAHLDAIDASLALLKVQTAALRHTLNVADPVATAPKAERVRFPRCEGISPALCALANDEARLDKRTFGNPGAWECRGCGAVGSTADLGAAG